jgi:(R,R)-butanediol dehydrogenase/meso-butanediol dehydrogenase/diacetyl reductase
LIGVRVYEPEDFEKAIAIAASGRLPLDRMISSVVPLEGLEPAFRQLESGGSVMKILIDCSGE